MFNDGITVIVGPNGCGKSNTVDAIRWVLGEQKAGSIRSEKMENVIFNGTKKTKPLGMAEVSLTIQNTRNILPIEYSEVTITRRLFRSLESQYLLNNAPCRLKDILNLFMDTGMGPNAYSIIELAMVETILNGKAEERRRIVEEAAGVTKYKIRRKAAFRKLEATEADLLRVHDIISEVEKTVTSLQRQVKKAQRYQELRQSLEETEVKLSTYQYSQIVSELEPLTKKLRETQNSRVALTSKFDEKEAEIEELRRQLLEAERYLGDQQKELNAVSQKIQKKEEEILVGRERRKALEDAKVKLVRDEAEVKSRIDKNSEQIAQVTEKVQHLFGRIQEAENDFQEKNAALNKVEVKIREKTEQLRSIENQRLKAIEGLTEGKRDEERVKTQLENIRQQVEKLNQEIEENSLLQKIRQEKIDKHLDKKTEAESKVRQVTAELEEVRSEMEELAKSKEQSKERILKRRTELETLRERIDLLKKFIESYDDHPEGVQHLLLESQLHNGVKGTLADNLTVEQTYRRAVETAIGDASVSLIVTGTDQAFECIDILNNDKKGAVTFFPLDRFLNGIHHRTNGIDISGERGVVDWAYNLVNCDDEYRPIVKGLLHDYLVVKDLKVAGEYSEKYKEKRLSLITLNGEVVTTWGPIKGGSTQSQSAIIGRKALVEELEQKLRETFSQLDEDENERQKIESNYQHAFRREQEMSNRLKSETSRLTELEVEGAQLGFEAKKDSELRERLQASKKEQIENQAALQEQFKAISPSLNKLVDSKSRFEGEFEKVTDELRELESSVVEVRDVAQDSRVKLVDLKGEERHLQENISRLQEYKKELSDSLARIDSEMETSTTEYGAIEKRIGENKAAIQIDFDEHRKLEAKVNGLEHKYRNEKEGLDAKEKLIREIRDERDLVSETLHTMELRVSELKHNADKIKERIKEEYELEIKKTAIEEELDVAALSEEIGRTRNRLQSMGPVNLLALKEYEKEKERLDFLTSQRDDLIEAENNLKETIRVINKTAREQFSTVFKQIQENFIKVFTGFFPNGQASLKLEVDSDPLEGDVVIEADPKGRRLSALTLLSGGEKTLTAISLLFAIYLVKPSPFCILDEVDAPLDDANIGRFVKAIREFSKQTQFLIVTHNKLTMRSADSLYGVTMEEEGVSKVVSVNFTEMEGLQAA